MDMQPKSKALESLMANMSKRSIGGIPGVKIEIEVGGEPEDTEAYPMCKECHKPSYECECEDDEMMPEPPLAERLKALRK
jgi:hypothetical protein